MQLEGRVAIVTGGGKGIGRFYCRALAQEGAHVVVVDIDSGAAESTAEEIQEENTQSLSMTADVQDSDSVKEMTARVLETFGRIDVLVNNAAFFASLPHRPFWEIDEEEWDHVMAVNVKGVFLCVRAVAPVMKDQGYGKIINISSGTVFKGTPGLLHYVSSKAAIVGMSRCLSRELGPFGIRVNVLAPGLTESDSLVEAGSTPPEVWEKILATRALARPEVPEDLTGTLIFLASAASDFITGQTIVVDGGSVNH